jgi:hypothetical protein
MDPHQHHSMQGDAQLPNSQPPYPFYPSSGDDHSYGLVYPSHQPAPLQPPYQIVNGSREFDSPPSSPLTAVHSRRGVSLHGLKLLIYHPLFSPAGPSSMSESDMLQYQRSLQMMPPQGHFTGPVYNGSPPHGDLQLSASPPPPSPSHIYDPISPNISGSDTGPYRSHSRGSNSSAGSPSSSRGHSFANRGSVRYNPTPSPTSTSSRRSRGRSISDEEDPMMGVSLAEHLANTRKEATRRQRIEAEQRRRDELRDGYARLKDVLPVSNQKSSKVSLLERGLYLRYARVPTILTLSL